MTLFADLALVHHEVRPLAEAVLWSAGLEPTGLGDTIHGVHDGPHDSRLLVSALRAAGVLAGRVWVPREILLIWSPGRGGDFPDPSYEGYPQLTLPRYRAIDRRVFEVEAALGQDDFDALDEWRTALFVDGGPTPGLDGWVSSPPCAVPESFETWVIAVSADGKWSTHQVPWEPTTSVAANTVMVVPHQERWTFAPLRIRAHGAGLGLTVLDETMVARPETVTA